MESVEYYVFNNKKYKIRRKNYKGTNGTIYQKYVISLPIGFDIKENKLKYHEYTANSIEELLSKLEYENGSGFIQSKLIPTQITAKELCDKWYSVVLPILGYSAKNNYKTAIKNHICPFLGNLQSKDAFTIDRLQSLINSLYEKGYQHQSIKSIANVLSKIIDYGIENRILYSNPVKYLIIPKTQERTYKILNREQMKELLKIAHKYEYGNCIAICMLGALRKGECLGLSIEDVDIDSCTIFVHQKLQAGRIVKGTKNGLSAKIRMPDVAKSFLLAEKERRIKMQQKVQDKWKNYDNLFFTGPNGHPVNAEKLRKDFNAMQKELGVEGLRIHDLRHSMATLISNLSEDLNEVQRYLRHKHIGTTKYYIHSTDVTQMKLVNAINKLLAS